MLDPDGRVDLPFSYEAGADELVLPGDQVLLFLNRSSEGEYYVALPGAGVYFIRGEVVVAGEANRFHETVEKLELT